MLPIIMQRIIYDGICDTRSIHGVSFCNQLAGAILLVHYCLLVGATVAKGIQPISPRSSVATNDRGLETFA